MFKNYLIIAIRNLLRHKLYSLINISGLAIGAGIYGCEGYWWHFRSYFQRR